MRQATPYSYLGPALVLYLLADAVAAHRALDAEGALTALVAALLSLSPVLPSRPADERGARRAGWLGLYVALSLVRVVLGPGLSLVVDVAYVAGLSGASAMLLSMALSHPDSVTSPGRNRALHLLISGVALAVCALGLLAVGPALRIAGLTLVVPTFLEHAPALLAAAALLLATALRLLRRRLGSGPEALASNAWALLGLLPVLLGALALALGSRAGIGLSTPGVRASLAALAVCLTWSHFRLVDPQQRLSVGRATRDAVAAVVALSLVAAAVAFARPLLPEAPLAVAALSVAVLLFALGLYRALRPLIRWLLAPAAGRLLSAVERAHDALWQAGSLRDVAAVALKAAREASGTPESEPWLHLLSPPLGLHIDAAGIVHESDRPLHPAVLRRLSDEPGEILVRAPLEAQLVRHPALRPLIDGVVWLDALCVVPLTAEGELEGALVIPRGKRRAALTLEELESLRGLSRLLTGFITVLGAEARAQQRANDERARVERARARTEELTDAMSRLGAELEQLRADRHGTDSDPLVSYSRSMRTSLSRLRASAREGGALLLVAERGVSIDALALEAHRSAGRGEEAFVVGDCAAMPAERASAMLLGSSAGPGLLRLASGGTLLLKDLPALPPPVQERLASALRTRQASPDDDGDAYPVRGLILCTSRVPLTRLSETGGLGESLARVLGERVLRVPPLRERAEDFPSLTLLALDRACRVLGRPVVGIDPGAQALLEAHDWPGNQQELATVIERAVAHCQGPRVTIDDLAFLGPVEQENPLDARLEVVERRVLERALERAAGNKSEAARLLGLKRTTFLDKLRRHDLDAPGGSTHPSSPPN